MDAYTSFAEVYDLFMDNVPYTEWCGYIVGLLEAYGIRDGLVLDLGCGTGAMTELLASAGYDMIGVDMSADMLDVAMEKRAASGHDILYLLQDMRSLELYGTVRAVVCLCDSLNYLLEEEELEQVFRLVNNYLDPGGVFIFDLNTEHKYRDILGDSTIAENREEGSFIWDNHYDEESRINEYDLALFIPEGERGEDLYRKYQETHFQRAYGLNEIRNALERSGLEFLAWYDEDGQSAPREDSERIYVIARERGKAAERDSAERKKN